MEKLKLLVVDDSELNRALLADILSGEYDVLEAANGQEALDAISKHGMEISLVLLDIVMPGMDGIGVLEAMRENGWIADIPVVMVSADVRPEQVERAYSLEATDFIARPFVDFMVKKRVANVLQLHARQKHLVSSLASQVYRTERSNRLMVDILSHIVEFRNGESGNHVRNVRRITGMLLWKLVSVYPEYAEAFDDETIELAAMASALHDIGKITIPSEILNKPGKLTFEEFEIMKGHSMAGAVMLEDLLKHDNDPLLHMAYEICRWHHERYDGRGYPDKLEGDAIPMAAQVVALADVYDALTSERAYKKAFPHETAIRMILDGECGAFNPELLDCLSAVADSLREELERDDSGDAYQAAAEGTGRILRQEGVQVSDRTLRLFEQERMKYDFFASLSGEVQFEYVRWPGKLTVAPFGAQKLGLPEVTEDPDVAELVRDTMDGEDYNRLVQMVRATSPGKPMLDFECKLRIAGEERWHRISVMATWSGDEPPRYTGAIGKAVDIHDARTETERLRQKAACDPLTGLLNHGAAREQIERRLAERPVGKHAFIVLDLDNFRNANNQSGGHAFGDRLLKRFAHKLQSTVRGGDIVARVGGDEFIIFLEYKDGVEPAAGRIFSALPEVYEGFPITVSMGVALAERLGTDYDVLFQAADAAAYWSKNHGRNRYSIYEDRMKDSYRSNITPAESDLDGRGEAGA